MINETDYVGRPVNSLQYMLRRIGFRDSRITPVVVDGSFDQTTAQAVSDFQGARGLPVTGNADWQTWEAIRNEYLDLLDRETLIPTPIFGDWRLAVEPDIEHPHIYIIQGMLFALSSIFPGLPKPELTGKNDEKTARAIMWIQNRTGLDSDGVMDKSLWDMLNGIYYAYITRDENYLPRPYSAASFANEGREFTMVS